MSSIHFRKNIDYYYIILTSTKLIYLIIGNCTKWFQVIGIKLWIFHRKTVYFYFYENPFDLCPMKRESEIVLTLTRPLRRKLQMRWFFDVSKVKESSFFFKSDLTDPLPPHNLMRIFWKMPILALPDFIFEWVLYKDHVLSQMVL